MRPDWREFVPTEGIVPDDLLLICTTDIQFRLERNEKPPLVQDYIEGGRSPGLDNERQFALIEFEYQWCWRHYAGKEAISNRPVRPPSREDYKRRFPGLISRVGGLKTKWKCIRCNMWTIGDEADEPPRCQRCGFGIDVTLLNQAPPQPSSIKRHNWLMQPDPAEPPPKEILGLYRLGRKLGAGGMGVVYVGQHSLTKQLVAIKVIAPEFERRPDIRARFLREMEIAGRIRKNNHIVPVFFADEDEGLLYLVMPFLAGQSLRERLKAIGKLSCSEVEQLGRETAFALASFHDSGRVHRDVKPENLWLERLPRGGWQVVLLDFGLARMSDGLDGVTKEGAFCGSPAYAPPEFDVGHFETTSDLFSLGCVLYEAATGTKAFKGATQEELRAAVNGTSPRPPIMIDPNIPEPLSDLVMSLLEKNSLRRPQSAISVAEAFGWRRKDTGDEVKRSVESASDAPTPGLQAGLGRRRLLIASIALLAILAAVYALTPGPVTGSSHASKVVVDTADLSAELRVLRIDVRHTARIVESGIKKGCDKGILGNQSFWTRQGDTLTLEASLSRSAFAYCRTTIEMSAVWPH